MIVLRSANASDAKKKKGKKKKQPIAVSEISGFGNNPIHPEWGQAGSLLKRVTLRDYSEF